METFNIDKHPLLDFCSDVKEIAEPLKDYFGITYFLFLKIYSDGSRIDLETNQKWMQYFYKQKLHLLEGDMSDWSPGSFLFSTNNTEGMDKIFHDGKKYFDIANLFIVIKKVSSGVEIYSFGAPEKNYQIIYSYLNHRDLLERFTFSFKEKAAGLIRTAERHKIILTEQDKISHPKILSYQLNQKTEQSYLKALGFDNINCEYNLLTSREKECATYVSQGKSAKEIGRILDISYRTVEKHIDQLKYKLDCSSVSKLIVKLLKNQGESVW